MADSILAALYSAASVIDPEASRFNDERIRGLAGVLCKLGMRSIRELSIGLPSVEVQRNSELGLLAAQVRRSLPDEVFVEIVEILEACCEMCAVPRSSLSAPILSCSTCLSTIILSLLLFLERFDVHSGSSFRVARAHFLPTAWG